MKIGIVNKSKNPNPEYKTNGSAGMDIRANISGKNFAHPGERVIVPTGLFLQIPPGFEIQVRPRSGLALNHGVTVLNTPGTIDSDYRGEIKVIIINHSREVFEIKNGDRIAQLIVSKVEKATWKTLSKLDETNRGEGGFGSTGKK
tara:strand:- start:2491 stop:2925 length:435 start_codon:yes stop_codon:yes gene_type:complete